MDQLRYQAVIDRDTGRHYVRDSQTKTYEAGPFQTRHEAQNEAERLNIKALYEGMGS